MKRIKNTPVVQYEDMKITIISVLAIALIIGGYVFIKDQRIKAELAKVEESKEVDSKTEANTSVVDSQVVLSRSNGVWAVTSTGEYTIDPSSLKFEFTGYKPGGQHVGTFNTVNATISLDEKGSPVMSQITLDPTSIKTDAEKLDGHLQAPEFFDTAKYPQVQLVIKEIKTEGNDVKAITDLTMKGVTKTLAIPVKVVVADDGIVFTVDTRIKISDYAMAYGPVQDEVRVMLSGLLHKTKTTNTQ